MWRNVTVRAVGILVHYMWKCTPNKCAFFGTVNSFSSFIGITAHCDLWPVEQCPPIFFPICQKLSPSSHSQHLKISFYFLFPFFPGSSLLLVPSTSWVKIFLGILSSSILSRWPNQLILYPFIYFATFLILWIKQKNVSTSHGAMLLTGAQSLVTEELQMFAQFQK